LLDFAILNISEALVTDNLQIDAQVWHTVRMAQQIRVQCAGHGII
jgi:hypothetical protein